MVRHFLLPLSLLILFVSEKTFSQSICLQFFNEAFSGGNQPRSITSGDFNHDGHLDLAMANFENSTVSILSGAGTGSFSAPVNYPCGGAPNDIAVADFNNDDHLDLVTANQAGSVSVFLGNSNGIFSDSVNYSTGLYVDAVTVDDINNDSVPDLITANESSSDISALLGNGDGTFQPAINSFAPGSICSIATGDFNNDGWKDVVYCHVLGFNEVIHYFCIQFGDGTGNFNNELQVDSVRFPIDAIAADVNNDGFADVITADFLDDSVSVYFGHGDGTFDEALGYSAYFGPATVVLSDINKDNIPDLLVANYEGNAVAALPGNGNGTFGNFVQELAVVDPQSLTVGDFNEDGLPDVATSETGFGGAYYAVILNCTVTGIEHQTTQPLNIYPNPAGNISLIVELPFLTKGIDYMISNVLGEIVARNRIDVYGGHAKVDASSLTKGSYCLKIISGNQVFVSKFEKL